MTLMKARAVGIAYGLKSGLLVAALATGCAKGQGTAGGGGDVDGGLLGGGGDRIDGGGGGGGGGGFGFIDGSPGTPAPDANPLAPDAGSIGGFPDAAVPPPDAAPNAVEETITYNLSRIIEGDSENSLDNTVVCASTDTGIHRDNRYFRVFDLAGDFGIDSEFNVTSVTLGILRADAGNDGINGEQSQPVDVILTHQDNPDVPVDGATEIDSLSVNITDGTRTLLEFPVGGAVPPGRALRVEFHIPDGAAADNEFHIGTNNDGENAPSFIIAPAEGCDIVQASTFEQIGFSNLDWVVEVTGTHTP